MSPPRSSRRITGEHDLGLAGNSVSRAISTDYMAVALNMAMVK